MNEGYPEDSELNAIENWKIEDTFGLLEFIADRWAYADWGYIERWGKAKITKQDTLFLELHTAGWSGNESIINALIRNRLFKGFFHVKWERGGHWYFEIMPEMLGYKRVSDYAKERGISRQRIHKSNEKYKWLTVGKRTQMIKPITP